MFNYKKALETITTKDKNPLTVLSSMQSTVRGVIEEVLSVFLLLNGERGEIAGKLCKNSEGWRWTLRT